MKRRRARGWRGVGGFRKRYRDGVAEIENGGLFWVEEVVLVMVAR